MIIISPYSKPLINGNRNAKNYPYWKELICLIAGSTLDDIVQIGTDKEEKIEGAEYFAKNVPFNILKDKVCTPNSIVIGVDNFLPHFAYYYGKTMIVLWGQSDPMLFGYKANLNYLKDRKYLRKDQFNTWEAVPYIEEAFLSAEKVFEQIKHLL